ncbi:MAG: hypothetical protein COZ69_09740 [Deltaproteobacteria bacterium CG_4_8_14_3_um_filter_45_9]|nr:MAG: hypothetical protein COZ69_09740 [Deltaproteobacteria bacterium CG_4_8_14_3_um_filter_45_9]
MLNLVQHLVWFFLPLADAPFIPVPAYRQALNLTWYRAGRHRTGFSGAILIKMIAQMKRVAF